VLGVILFAAVLLGGVPRFGGPIWNPGRLQSAPQPTVTSAPTLPPVQHSDSGQTSLLGPAILFGLIAIAAGFVIWLVVRVLLRARGVRTTPHVLDSTELVPPPLAPDAGAEDDTEPDAPIVHRGLRLALDALDEDREPADAIVKAWLGLQAAAEDSGVERRAAETPTEFTSRVITRVQADAGAAAQLVDVYQGVRFGGHPITSADVHAARSAIEKLLDSWHEPILRARR